MRVLFQPLTSRPFRWLAGGRFLVFLSNAITPIALSFAVLDWSGSLAALSFVIGARSAGNVVALLLGGVIADRLSPGVVMRWGPPVAGLVQGVIALLVIVEAAAVPALVGLAALNGMAAAISMPASMAVTPQTVPQGVLREANSLLRLAVNSAMIGGAALGGVLVATTGAGWALAVDAVAFMLAGLCFSLMGTTPVAEREQRTSVIDDLRSGWREFIGHDWLWPVVLFAMLWQAVWAGSTNVLGPAIADRSFGPQGWGIIVGALSLGLVIGSILALRWRPARALSVGILLVAVTAGFPLGLAVTSSVYVLVATAFLAGVALEQFVVAWDVSLQQNIPGALLPESTPTTCSAPSWPFRWGRC